MSTDISLQRTCYACPEQYDAINEAGEVVGYLRLRHGYFTAQAGGPDGPEVYEARPEGDGIFTDEERQGYLDAAVEAIRGALAAASAVSSEPVTEYGGGGDGRVYQRRVIVLEDWTEITGEQSSARDYAATHPIVCAHADDDSQGSHILAPGEKCNRGKS